MTASTSHCLVTINVPPALEDAVVDWLLTQDLDQGFTSYQASGHGSDHDVLSIEERVRGRQRRVEFRLVLVHQALDAFLDALRADFAGADLFFYAVPVLRTGHFAG